VAALLSPTDPHHLFTLSLYGSIPDVWEWDDSGQVTTPYSFEPAPIDPRITFLTSMTISRDGETLAAGDTDGAVHLWDARTGKLRSGEGLPRTGQPVLGVAIDPRGEVLATATDSGLRLQDPNAGRVRVLSFSDATTVVFDPSGDHLASMSTDGTVRIWDRQGEIEKDLKVSGDVVRSLAFSSDGTLIAGGTAEGLVQIWNVESGRTVMISRQHSAWVNDVRFLPGDNSTLISASDDSYVARWRCAACTDPEGVIRDAVDWVNSQ
jgi:WD40 repeat protein